MSRRDDERLADIIASADAIASHLELGSLNDGPVFDAASASSKSAKQYPNSSTLAIGSLHTVA